MSKFYGRSLDKVPNSGGSVQLEIASNHAHQVASIPCKKVWISAERKQMRVTIGTPCAVDSGIVLPIRDGGETYSGELLVLEIDDINKLYFYGAVDGKTVDILYRE